MSREDTQMPARPFDVEKLMRAVAKKNPVSLTRERLRLALALEIHEAVRDSRLLIGPRLRGNGNSTQIDMLGLVGEQKLAIQLSCGAFDADSYSRDVEHLEQVCALDTELIGLALIVTDGAEHSGNGNGRPLTWHNCATEKGSPWAGVEYAFTWIVTSVDRSSTVPPATSNRPGKEDRDQLPADR